MSKKDKNKVENQEQNDDKIVENQQVESAPEANAAESAAPKEKSPEELIQELKETVLRSRADFDNFRKRTQRDIADARSYGKISAIDEILPVIDTFKMAMQAANMNNADLQTLLAGMNMIQNQFNSAFGNLGIVEINAVGEKFDPTIHEAVSEKSSSEIGAGVVISQHRCGYKLGEKLIRAASVVVSSGPEVVGEVKE